MITFNINQNNIANLYTTPNYSVVFTFLNENWFFVATNFSYYTVVNQLNVFMFEFYDQEDDKIVLILEHYDEIGLYSQQDTTSKQKINLLLQANLYLLDPIKICIIYTDSYHQDPSFYQNITISVYTFLVDPPSFENRLETFNADRWSDYSLVLPKIIDPNNLICFVSINSPIPDWIKLENNTLLLNTIDTKFNIPETTVITLKITNEQKSWREYNQTIITSMNLKPIFAIIENIDILINSIVEVDVYIESYHKVDAIDWYNNLSNSWIIISSDHSKMYINSTNLLEQLKWAKLRTYDSWK